MKTCSVDGCTMRHRAKGYCSGHYQQARNGRQLHPVQVYGPKHPAPKDGMKWCPRCSDWVDRSGFYVVDRYADGLSGWCRGCHKLTVRAGNYGLTPDETRELLGSGMCDACGRPTPDLEIDHDHACCPGGKTCGRCVRGVLCRACNGTLGLARDDAERLLALVAYLKRSSLVCVS